jgi:hypothetical protein
MNESNKWIAGTWIVLLPDDHHGSPTHDHLELLRFKMIVDYLPMIILSLYNLNGHFLQSFKLSW